MKPIGIIRSPYQEKFAVPRQPGLVPSAIGYCDLLGESSHPDAIRGLEQFSHIWILFEFHQTKSKGWQPLVRPPRLGGNKKVGVFASRSTFRPNAIGMSLVSLKCIEHIRVNNEPCNRLTVSGLDLVDGTPILDIKPYLPYVEAIPDAQAGYASEAPAVELEIQFSPEIINSHPAELIALIRQVLQQDPRPAYQKDTCSSREYGLSLAGYNVRFSYPTPGCIQVISMTPLPQNEL